jgi:predicted CXXCH cytochrome family protein
MSSMNSVKRWAGEAGRRAGGRPLSNVLVALLGLALAASLTGCSGEDEAVAPPAPGVLAAADAARVQKGYVGSDACQSCHAAEFSAWEASRHKGIFRQGARPAYAGSAPEQVLTAPVGVSTAMLQTEAAAAAGELTRDAIRIDSADMSGTLPVDAVIGGGKMEAYASHLPDGRWLLLPLTYLPASRTFLPFTEPTCGVEIFGYTTPTTWHSYERIWNHRCIDCHVTAGSIGYDPAGPTWGTRFVDPGAGCEACHGPGEAHVAAAKAGRGTEGIVHPGRLGPAGGAEVCASCHALAIPFESRWGGNPPFKPGDTYSEAFLPLLSPASDRFKGLTYADHTPSRGVMEYQGMAQSSCFLGGELTCTTCHDPHGAPSVAALKADPATPALCADCHQAEVAAGREHSHHDAGRPGGSCVDCHMPPTIPSTGTRHATHVIDVPLPVNKVDFGAPDACTLCHADRGDRWAVEAYTRLWGSPEERRRRKLARAFAGPDPVALRRLLADRAESALLRADAAAALAVKERIGAAPDLVKALEGDPSLIVRRHAADLLGGLGPDTSMTPAEQIQRFVELESTGVLPALRRASDAGPSPLRLDATAALARLDVEDATRRLEALRADARLDAGYRLHQALGNRYLLTQRMDEARAAYETVLSRTPNSLSTLQDLAFVEFTTGNPERARDLWKRALAIDPASEKIKLNIHLAEDQMRGKAHEADGEGAAVPD